MSGFRKYLIVLGSAFTLLWAVSIVIYWDVIARYVGQSVGGFLEKAVVWGIVLIILIALFRR